jgi:hypothetical protein
MRSSVTKVILWINLVLLSLLILVLLAFLIYLNTTEDVNPVTIIGSMILCGAIVYSCVFFGWNLKIFKASRSLLVVGPDDSRNSIIIFIFGVVLPYILIIADLVLAYRQ